MTLTIELDAQTERTLETKARERGVSVELYARELLEQDAQNEKTERITAASLRGKYAGNGDDVDNLLRERREEAEAERKNAIRRARGMLPSDGHEVDRFLAERRAEAQREIEYSKRDFPQPQGDNA